MTSSSQPRCAIIIPTYNGAHLLPGCLDALLQHPSTECRWEVVVVDDASEDGTLDLLDQYKAVRAVPLKTNSGFAVACNTGARASGDVDYLLFLNNDTLPTEGWLDALVDAAKRHPAAAAFGAKLLYPNGLVQHAGVAISQDRWPRHLYTGLPGEHSAVNREKKVIAVTAACLLVRQSDFNLLGGFDPAFHNGYEDIDLCLRIGELGREIRYCPASLVYHLESVTRWPKGPEPTTDNDALYDRRWRNRVMPDDVQHFIADGLIRLDYRAHMPLAMTVSPLLACVQQADGSPGNIERLLAERTVQVMDLLATQTRTALQLESMANPAFHLATSQSAELPRHEVLCMGTAHRIGSGSGRRLISLLMPVKNEAHSLSDLLPMILEQSLDAMLEIVAVDSGSEDDTVNILRQYGATVLEIDPAEFDHGLTRNLAARQAKGEILLFVNARTRPVDDKWLAPLVAALDEDATVVGACSRVLAHPDADMLTMRDVGLDLSGSAIRQRKEITDWEAYRQMSVDERRALLNFHTVSAALRADLFARIPFRSVPTIGEDLMWAREVLEGGWALVHEPASCAYHSHNYSLRELFARNVDDGVANRAIVGRALDEKEIRPLIDALVGGDWEFLRQACDLTDDSLTYWQREAQLRRVAQVVGQWVGINHDKLPDGVASTFSRIGNTRQRVPRDVNGNI